MAAATTRQSKITIGTIKLAVVIPAYNEAKTISDLINRIPRQIKGASEVVVIVVNDNSKDETAKLARAAGAVVLTHQMNLGAGGAVLTGIKAAKRLGCQAVVTMDGDGQHNPKDIEALLQAHLKGHNDLVLGSRFLSSTIESMPKLKWYGNKIMNGITYIFSGLMVSDSQSGFRLIGRRLLNMIDQLHMGGYEFCSEMIVTARRHDLLITEVPIQTIYFDDRKGQNPLNGVNIFLRLLFRSLTI